MATNLTVEQQIKLQEIELKKQELLMQMAINNGSLNKALWPGISNTISTGYGYSSMVSVKRETMVTTGGDSVLRMHIPRENLKDVFLLGNKPEAGTEYRLYCKTVEDDNGDYVLKFILV